MRDQRKHLIGVVTSDKMDKTVVVTVESAKRHPIYGKIVRTVKKYKAHDESNDCRMGDRVEIIESRPISRHKRWAVVQILARAK
jgi:small subunit ribosomal protein S17